MVLSTGEKLQTLSAIGIVASTGGPPILEQALSVLPADFPVPIFLIQHIALGFENGFVQWLSEKILLPVHLVSEGFPVQRGVHFGPNNRHMSVTKNKKIHLEPPLEEEFHSPSGDWLLASLAEVYGEQACGIILTGMGDDGVRGLQKIRLSGGLTLAQDQESSLIWGMPGEAVRTGAAQRQASPQEISAWLLNIAKSYDRTKI